MLWEVAGLFEDFGTVKDGVDVLARRHKVVDVAGAPALTVKRGENSFSDVHFNYGKEAENSREVLAGLNLVIEPGEKVGLVGRSGAGKSTLANLLLRFYDVSAGTITIDGQNIAGVAKNPSRSNRRGHPRHIAHAPLGARQYPLWQTRCQRSRNQCRIGPSPCIRIYQHVG